MKASSRHLHCNEKYTTLDFVTSQIFFSKRVKFEKKMKNNELGLIRKKYATESKRVLYICKLACKKKKK